LVIAGLHVGATVSVLLLAALAGASFGFLRHNYHPASIFLGDSGSQFIGFVFAIAPLANQHYKAATAVSLLIPLTALSIPIYDTALAIVRRLRGRRSIFHADKYHLHHRLLKMGLSQQQVVWCFYLASIYLTGLAFLFVLIRGQYALVLLVLLALGLIMAMQVLRFIEFKLRRQYRRRWWRGVLARR